jgi:hypothetical protein
MSTGTLMHHGL